MQLHYHIWKILYWNLTKKNYLIMTFSINENIIKVEHSTVRSTPNIPGVLVLDTKKVYGKIKINFYINLF